MAVERLRNPSLAARPVIIGGADSDEVLACSTESKIFGIRGGMPLDQARRSCPHAIFLPGNSSAYLHYSQLLTRFLADQVPVLEKASAGSFYADLTDIGDPAAGLAWTRELLAKAGKETGLSLSAGLSAGKFVSRMAAAEAGAGEVKAIRPGTERAFLAPFPVHVLSADERVSAWLEGKGIKTLGQLADMAPGALQRLLGSGRGNVLQGSAPPARHGDTALSLWQKARGICNGSVVPYSDPSSLSGEMTFPRDCRSRARLLSVTGSIADKLSFVLRKKGLLAAHLSVRVRYADFSTLTRRVPLSPSMTGRSLARKAQDLLQGLCDVSRGVRMVGLRFEDVEQQVRQMQLFGIAEAEKKAIRPPDGEGNLVRLPAGRTGRLFA